MNIPFYSKWRAKRRTQKKAKAELARQRTLRKEQFSAELTKKITDQKLEIKAQQKQMATLEQSGAVFSTDFIRKKSKLDKIRAQRIEIEIRDGERSTITTAKVVDGLFIEFRYKGKKQKKIIATKPTIFEYPLIPVLWWRRGLKYYILAYEETTCLPFSTVPKLTQAKLAMGMVGAVAKYKMWYEVARSTQGSNRKELMLWLITIGLVAIVGILASGDYFK